MVRARNAVAAAAATLVVATSVTAEGTPPAAQPAGGVMEDEFAAIELFRSIDQLRPRIRLSQEGTIHQDFSGAHVDTYRTLLRAQIVAPLSERLAIRLLGSSFVSTYDFHGDSQFLDTGKKHGDPFDELLSTQLRLEGRYRLSDDWALIGGGSYRSRWERGAAYESGIQGGGFAGLGYIFAERFSVIAAVSVQSRLGRSGATVAPLVRLGFKPIDNVEIETVGMMGGRVAYRPIKPLTVFVRGALDSERFRLKKRDDEVGRGTLRNESASVVAGWRWQISRRWRFLGHLGAVVYQQWRVAKKGGGTVDVETSRSPAFTARFQIEYRM